MKYAFLLVAVLLVGCSEQPRETYVPFLNTDILRLCEGGLCEDVGRIIEEMEEDILAIKNELTGVETGCRLEVDKEAFTCMCNGREVPSIHGGCGCDYPDEKEGGLQIIDGGVKTLCKGDKKEIDDYEKDNSGVISEKRPWLCIEDMDYGSLVTAQSEDSGNCVFSY